MYIQRDQVRLYYETQGSGYPPLLFVHGWLTNADIWKHQISHFKPHHQTVAIDLRGFGRSDKPVVEYTFDLFAEDLRYLMEQLQLDRPVLIGWSKGVSISLVYAASYMNTLSKMVLVGGGPKFLSSDDFAHGLDPDAFQNMLDEMRNDYESGVRALLDAEFPEEGTESLKEWLFAIADQTPAWVALNSIVNDTRYDLRPLLGKITLPSLIVYGELDTICPPGANKAIHEGLPNSEIHELPGLGHAPFLTDPQRFNSILEDFLSS